MNYYIVSLNGQVNKYTEIEDIPFEIYEEAVVEFYENDVITYLKYYKNGNLHREDGPAFIKHYPDASVEYEMYYLNGTKHREDGPAIIHYYINSKRFNADGSFSIEFNNGFIELETYYIDGKRHREDGPAMIGYYQNNMNTKFLSYYINGEFESTKIHQ
jgi:uncharacterized protein